jgi:Cu2+-exporting ATPase
MISDQRIQRCFPVEGMSCASCVLAVERALGAVPGVEHVTVSLADHSATVVLHRPVPDEALKSAVRNAGYDLEITDVLDLMEALDRAREARLRDIRLRFLLSATFTLPLVVVAMLLPHGAATRWAQLLLAAPVILGAGYPFFRSAWRQAKHMQANMDSLVALSSSAAFTYSLYLLLGYTDAHAHLHFESAAVVITFVWLGRYLEGRAKSRAGGAIRQLMGMRPERVMRFERDGRLREVPLGDVIAGDELQVRAGERVAVDGTVVNGTAAVDESMFTGEPLPVERLPGMRVLAGSMVQHGGLRIRAVQVGAGTHLSRVARAVQEAQGSKAPVQLLVDRVASRFVPAVLLIALLAAAAWWILGGPDGAERGLQAFITVLIIACPCALGLATPTAIMAGIGKGADSGILIRGAESLERTQRITAMVMDKTGTLTVGRPRVVERWSTLSPADEAVMSALEQRSTHPLAAALVEALPPCSAPSLEQQVREVPGEGMYALHEGHQWVIGNRRAIESAGILIAREHGALERSWQEEGRSTVWVAVDGVVRGLIAFEDVVRDSAREAVSAMAGAGITVYMQTGDGLRAARRVAASVGIDHVRAEVSPKDKAAFVRALQAAGDVVAMVGDGVNDAEALALADVGFAMGQGSDVAMGVAHVTVLGDDLGALPRAIILSRRTMATIRQNLFWAFIYNVISIPVAAGVLVPVLGFTLDPVWAGMAMAFSSVSVVLNSLRLRLH